MLSALFLVMKIPLEVFEIFAFMDNTFFHFVPRVFRLSKFHFGNSGESSRQGERYKSRIEKDFSNAPVFPFGDDGVLPFQLV